jgi:hypothetical protein
MTHTTEINKTTLDAALRQMPQQEPPMLLWEQIEEAIDLDENIGEMARQLPDLPLPADLWSQLETRLDPPMQVQHRRLRFLWPAVAASLALLCAAWWWWSGPMPAESSVAVAIHEEVIDDALLEVAKEPEDAAFEMVQELCQQPLPVCEQPEFKAMKTTLDELTNAKKQLKEAMGQYGADPDLSAQLIQIEQERSELLQAMMHFLS